MPGLVSLIAGCDLGIEFPKCQVQFPVGVFDVGNELGDPRFEIGQTGLRDASSYAGLAGPGQERHITCYLRSNVS